MIKIAICDDEHIFYSEIESLIGDWTGAPTAINTYYFDNGDALLSAHKSEAFDIILLDVVMPVLNGIDAAQEIREFDRNVKLIFLTSSPEYAVDSYSVKASNYLLKPLVPEKLFSCLAEIIAELEERDRYILVKGTGKYQRIPLNKIEYLEAQNKHVKFALTDGPDIISTDKLHVCEEKLSLEANFFKVHRSYIVNMHNISSYSNKEITMRSGERIPISRGSYKDFETAYFSVIFGEAGDER